MTERAQRGRLIVAAAAVGLVLAGLGARLVYLHVGPGAERRVRIEEARRLEQDLRIGRGRILDRNGNLLALDLDRKSVCVDPALVASNGGVERVAARLTEALALDGAAVRAQLDRPSSRFAFVGGYGRTIDDELAATLAREKLPGVFFNEVTVRSYPRGASMGHVLGYVNLEGRGSAGIEQRWDEYMRGIPGLLVSELDGHRRELYERRSLEIKPRHGADVRLTLDQYVQYIVERALDTALAANEAQAAWAIVQRVATGEILAMAVAPAFDPNQFRQAPPDRMRNRCVSYLYEPGSTFKVGVVAAALNEGVVTPGQIFDCENGSWFYKGRPLRDFHPYGLLNVADVLKKSSNIGAAKIALLLGNERLHRYLRAFGVGAATGIDVPGEEGGLLHPPAQWNALSPTRIAIGHEVAVTALQMLGVVSAIANDGVLMKPYLVERVVDVDGRVLFRQEPTVASRPIRPETAALMRELLVRVTEEGGTGTKARVAGYTVGGKTGTAQKVMPGGGYSDALNIASFVGFVPAADPQLAIIAVVDEPRGNVHTGGYVSAPVFREIAEQVVRYLDIPPSTGTLLAGAAPARVTRVAAVERRGAQ